MHAVGSEIVRRAHFLATALLGVWLGWTLAMWFAATRSFRTVDRILKRPTPQFESAIQPLGKDERRVLLRHVASEINRTYFAAYGWGQIVLGIIVAALIWYQNPRDTLQIALAGVMLGLAIILAAIIQPMIVSLGRNIDFAAPGAPPSQMQRFWMYHGAFTGLDSVKLLAGLGLLVRLMFR